MATLDAAQKNYDANLKNIPWDMQFAKVLKDSNTQSNALVNSNLPIFNNLVEQEARNVNGTANQRQAARNRTDAGINDLKRIPLNIDDRIARIDIGGIQNKIKSVEEQIASERAKQSKSNELLEIRKEQSAALEKKYSSNLHSSWLGLWRPLKDDTHVGLNVASFAFGLLALIAIAYLTYSYISAPASSGGSITTNVIPAIQTTARNLLSNLSGGFRKVKSSH